MKRTLFLIALLGMVTAQAGWGQNTLERAYNQGGPGAGRIIKANAGSLHIKGPYGLVVDGNIGIGTTARTYKLNIDGAKPLLITGGGTPYKKFQFDIERYGYSVFRIYDGNTREDFRFATNGDSWLNGSGDVGIGKNNPVYKLDIEGGSIPLRITGAGRTKFIFDVETGGYATFRMYDKDIHEDIRLVTNGHSYFNGNGNLGIGTTNPTEKLEVNGLIKLPQATGSKNNSPGIVWKSNDDFLYDGQYLNSYGFGFHSYDDGGGINGVHAYVSGWYGIDFFTGGKSRLRINRNGSISVAGTTITKILQITGGSDLAEPFDIASAEPPAPGMVVSIDSEHPGQLRLADAAYDRTVAGVVSGAGGINPGMLMGQSGSVADGAYPVALTGRVYCLADAANGPIAPGDLLTTSDTPGHAMKVSDHDKAQGAIIGKAMTALKDGRGLVLVLVSLQ